MISQYVAREAQERDICLNCGILRQLGKGAECHASQFALSLTHNSLL